VFGSCAAGCAGLYDVELLGMGFFTKKIVVTSYLRTPGPEGGASVNLQGGRR